MPGSEQMEQMEHGEWAPGDIPRRNTQWETPFSAVAPANAELDAVREVAVYSAKRRKVAIAITASAALFILAAIAVLVIATIKVGYTDERRYLIVNYIGLLLMIAFLGTGVFAAWKWANVPLTGDQPLR
jgi:hypothetical protein